jgi:hypothetical protein
MTDHRHQPESDEAGREKESSPIGVAPDLAEEAEEQGGSTDPQEIEDADEPRH